MRRFIFFLFLAGCGALTPPLSGAGEEALPSCLPPSDNGIQDGDGGMRRFGAFDGGEVGDGSLDSGVTSTVDAGSSWVFSSIGISPRPTSGKVVGFAETDAGLMAMNSYGEMLRSAGGPFFQVVKLPQQIVAFQASASGGFYAVGTVSFLFCLESCDVAASWTEIRVDQSRGISLKSVCVISDSNVLLVGNQSNYYDGVGVVWDGVTLGQPTLTGRNNVGTCSVSASGGVLIPAENGAVRYDPLTRGFSAQEISPPQAWQAAGSAAGRDWLFASGPRAFEFRSPNWVSVISPQAGSDTSELVTTVVGTSSTTALAFGRSNSLGQIAYRYDGTAWNVMPADLAGMTTPVTSFRSRTGDVYVGGSDRTGAPIIVRGRFQ
jgi:hypothetical protein